MYVFLAQWNKAKCALWAPTSLGCFGYCMWADTLIVLYADSFLSRRHGFHPSEWWVNPIFYIPSQQNFPPCFSTTEVLPSLKASEYPFKVGKSHVTCCSCWHWHGKKNELMKRIQKWLQSWSPFLTFLTPSKHSIVYLRWTF